MPKIPLDRDEAISIFMEFISMIVKSYIKEMKVPEELQSNCYWAVKKYMRKVLNDHTDGELKVIQSFVRKMSKVDVVNAQVATGNYVSLFPVPITDLIESAIKGYLNYKKVKIKKTYSIPIPYLVDPPTIR